MNQSENSLAPEMVMNRRRLISGAIGLTFAISIGANNSALGSGSSGRVISAWVTIGADDIITIMSPAAEMGQGTFTSLPLVIAEEMDADWSHVRPIVAPPDHTKYGNPGFGGLIYTAASRSVKAYFTPLRIAGAQVRLALLNAVSKEWSVPVDELTTRKGVITHIRSGRDTPYGRAALLVDPSLELPKIAPENLKSATQFVLIGKDVPRAELPLKTTGAAKYASDVRLPNMLYAAVLQAPTFDRRPEKVDDSRARALSGVVQVVGLPDAVAVIAANTFVAQRAKSLLEVSWTSSPSANFDSEQSYEDYFKIAQDDSRRGIAYEAAGDARDTIKGAPRVMRAEYGTRYTYHAQMEPLSATAIVSEDGKSCEIWAGSQSPSVSIFAAAGALKIPPSSIRFNQLLLGGGFGRRSQQEVVIQAVLLAKALPGRPIKVVWSREDDIRFGKFRPMTAHRIEAALDPSGKIVAWHHRIASESVLKYAIPQEFEKLNRKDFFVMKGTELPYYGIPNKLSEHIIVDQRSRVSAWRGVGVAHNMFASESFLDEVAHSLKSDPYEFRMRLLSGSPRAQNLLRTVAEMSEWTRRRDGRGLGMAFVDKEGTLGAAVAEVSIDRQTGQVAVERFWAAVDLGVALQPNNIVGQVEGAIVFGLGHMFREQISIKNGEVQQSNFHDYRIARMAELPRIEVRVVSTDNPPCGAGEIGTVLCAATIGNAIFSLTGVRFRELPITREKVLANLR